MDEQLDFAKDLAYEAGKIMLQYFKVGADRELKEDNSPVTIADTTINDMVINAVAEKYPEHSVLGEEASDIKEGSKYTWVCDPIDGTVPYTFGMPTNMFALALTEDGVPVLGVMYDPYMERLFSAQKGGGAFMNDTPIRVSQETGIEGKRIGMSGLPKSLVNTVDFFASAAEHKIRNLYVVSTVYEGSLVASGQIVGSVFPGTTAHDIAAIKIVIEEAGGKVTDLHGNEQKYDRPIKGAITSNGKVHDQLVELLAPHV
jgi:myo-inositol-1(or 4)-monophosphatase